MPLYLAYHGMVFSLRNKTAVKVECEISFATLNLTGSQIHNDGKTDEEPSSSSPLRGLSSFLNLK